MALTVPPHQLDLRVSFGGLELANPVMTASGTFGYGVEFANLTDLDRLVDIEQNTTFFGATIGKANKEDAIGRALRRLAANADFTVGKQANIADGDVEKRLSRIVDFEICRILFGDDDRRRILGRNGLA